jgi:hypothetical protein
MRIERTDVEQSYAEQMEEYFQSASGTLGQRLVQWPKFASRQTLSIFLYKSALFQRILNVQGSILEFGVFMGAGLFTWGHLSSIFEPVNYQRKIIGFDTIDGFPEVSDADRVGDAVSEEMHPGGFRVEGIYEDIQRGAELFDMNRSIGHIEKLRLVRGDVNETIPRYLEEHPYLVASMLYLDLDLYQPTKRVIELLWDRVPRGGVIAFDEVNAEEWPGETQAVIETLGLGSLRLERVPYEPLRCFAVKE